MPFRGVKRTPLQAFVHNGTIKKVENLRPGKSVRADIDHLRSGKTTNGWRHVQFSKPDIGFDLTEQITSLDLDPNDQIMFMTLRVTDWELQHHDKTVSDQWIHDLRQPLVPFNGNARKKVAASASPLAKEFVGLAEKVLRREKKQTKLGVIGEKSINGIQDDHDDFEVERTAQ